MGTEKKTLYEHIPHVHFARNVNCMAETEQQAAGTNSEDCSHVDEGRFIDVYGPISSRSLRFLALFGFLAGLIHLSFYSQHGYLNSSCNLCFCRILAVGQDVLSRHQQLQAEEAYQTTLHSFHDLEQMKLHEDVSRRKNDRNAQ